MLNNPDQATNGPRYVVGCRRQLEKSKLKPGTRVALDMTTLTIMRHLPREVDPLVYNMSHEDPGDVSYSNIGGLGEQIRELREVIELPLLNPELFMRVGIVPPKGCLLYGPPGTGKTLLARAVASQLDANFLKVVSSAIVDKYIGRNYPLGFVLTDDTSQVNPPGSSERCSTTLGTTSPASSLWTRSTPSEAGGSVRAHRPTEKSRGH